VAVELPADFRFGVATAGFQVEGGFNGPGEPANNWRQWEASGRVEPSGIALDFWNRYEEHLDRATAAGCDSFRLSVEWARVEPEDGVIDDTALDRYAAILDACEDRGLRPLVTLHHFTHPDWLGADFWLQADAPERFAEWAGVVADHLGSRCRHWVTTNEINVLALQMYWTGVFPPGRWLNTGAAVRALDYLLGAHVLAYSELHARRPDAVVTTNNYVFSVYEMDRLLIDVLVARRHGVSRHEIRSWLTERRAEYYAALGPARGLERGLRRFAAATIPLDQAFPRALAAVYASPHITALDVVAVDYYDPVVSHHLRVPGHRTAGGRNWLPGRMLWDDVIDPPGLARYCRLNHEPGLDLWVLENGLCNRVRRGVAYARDDAWDRVRYLQANLTAVGAALDGGVPVRTYFHWTLADNYEWGSYEPRFGLYGIDRERGLRWSEQDSFGGDAVGEYRRLIDDMRAGGRPVSAAG
jgi:beta-glucosidase